MRAYLSRYLKIFPVLPINTVPKTLPHFSVFLTAVSLLLSTNFCLSVWATITKDHRLCGVSNTHLFLTVLESRYPRPRSGRLGGWWEPAFQVRENLLQPVLTGRKRQGRCLVLSLSRSLIPSMRTPSLGPRYLPTPPKAIVLEVRFWHMDFEET